ncbi:MAG: 50S ribosomal protein L24 [Candidatus Limnocylindria bacterium]
MRVRKGDEVMVIAGKDSGKRGRVQEVDRSARRIIVAGVNIVKRHTKANPQRNVKGGIVEQPASLDASKVMLVCPHCGKPTRVRYEMDEGEKSRVCKQCGEAILVEEKE